MCEITALKAEKRLSRSLEQNRGAKLPTVIITPPPPVEYTAKNIN
jgi:hypothetical protein